jgi:pimeloyl-ACP methyl ester carboxylesterase
MLFFLSNGYRVVAHDRRGHGRSSQVSDGHDMTHYAADAAAVADHLDLTNAIHIGHSTGGGEVARYVAQYGKGRIVNAVLVSAVPPLMLKTESNPHGTPIEVFDSFRKALAGQPRPKQRALVYSYPIGGPILEIGTEWDFLTHPMGLLLALPELISPGVSIDIIGSGRIKKSNPACSNQRSRINAAQVDYWHARHSS